MTLDLPFPWGPADRTGIMPISGGTTGPSGFRAAGVASGVKASGKPDLAVLVSNERAAAAAVTTTNRVKASACHLTDRHVADGAAQAVVINSGNANVCTPDGHAHTELLAKQTAQHLQIAVDDVLVMSTGVIGVPLPIGTIVAALPTAVSQLSTTGGHGAAVAMMTTDTHPKEVAYDVQDAHGGRCTIGGMVKGVGMIEPAMATMLAVITTDAQVPAPTLDQILRDSVAITFNRISVDGDGSTSDTVAILANGAAGPVDESTLARAIHAVCAELAAMVVTDGEGATRIAGVTVSGTDDHHDAESLARSVATSLLVRAALHGADPNWGRILMALGNAGVDFDPRQVQVDCAGVTVCRGGVAVPFDHHQAAQAMQADAVAIDVVVGAGPGVATVLTCDLTPEYVRFNSEYTT
ncbi:MAG: bifunctional glutamate N-acetyltransferase/amino-acid acetyltransferase ArgJ [Nitriliruptoraceae bacterium]